MARKKKLTHCEAKAMLQRQGIDFNKDVFELSTSQLTEVADVSRKTGYRKSKNAPGSTGRMYFQLLQRQRHCRR